MISSSTRLPHKLCAFIIPFLINSLTLKDWHSTECEQGVKATVIFYKGILAAFDNGVKLIVMHSCIVRLKYGTAETEILVHIWQPGSQLLQLPHTNETEQKVPDVEIIYLS